MNEVSHSFCALRFAARGPSAGRKKSFSSFYGPTKSPALILVSRWEALWSGSVWVSPPTGLATNFSRPYPGLTRLG